MHKPSARRQRPSVACPGCVDGIAGAKRGGYWGKLVTIIGCILLTFSAVADSRPLPEIYREAKAALEAGDAARCAALLAPVLQNASGEVAAPAQLALGMAWLRMGKPADAISALEEAVAGFANTPQAPDALASLGDALRAADRPEDAKRAYAQAADATGGSVNIRYARARSRELEGETLQTGGKFSDAANAYLEAADLMLALSGEDAAYFADARALYEKVAKGTGKPDKDWRGEPTARAVFGLGEVERAQGHFPEAVAYYQRTFVSWVRYPHWAARAYLRAAECMDKLGKREFAIRHLRELIRKVEKFGTLPEYQQAKQQLRAWGQTVR